MLLKPLGCIKSKIETAIFNGKFYLERVEIFRTLLKATNSYELLHFEKFMTISSGVLTQDFIPNKNIDPKNGLIRFFASIGVRF